MIHSIVMHCGLALYVICLQCCFAFRIFDLLQGFLTTLSIPFGHQHKNLGSTQLL